MTFNCFYLNNHILKVGDKTSLEYIAVIPIARNDEVTQLLCV